MPRIPLCPQCEEPVIAEDQDYVDLTEQYGRNQEELLIHIECYPGYKRDVEKASKAS